MENTTFLEQTTVFNDVINKSDDTTDILSMAKMMHWTSSVIIGTVFVVIGLAGNSLSIYIWSRKSMKSSTGIYLIGLAIMDSLLLIFFYLVDAISMVNPGIKKNYYYALFYCYIGFPMFFFFVVTSIWILVGVTVDRYIYVCWITKTKAMCTQRRALTGIGIISFLCMVVNLPHFNSYYPVYNPASGADAIVPTEFTSGVDGMRYEFYVHCIFLVLAPWFTIFVLNMLIINKVAKVNRKMNDKKMGSGKSRSEYQITRVLLTVTFTFLVLIAFQCITQCFFMLKPAQSDHRIVDEAFAVAKLGVVINSSINFFLYCLSGQRFRRELCHLLRSNFGCCRTEDERDFSSVLMESSSGVKTSSTDGSRF